MLYDTHYKEGKKVTFKKFDLNLAGLLFLPPNFEESKKMMKKMQGMAKFASKGGFKMPFMNK